MILETIIYLSFCKTRHDKVGPLFLSRPVSSYKVESLDTAVILDLNALLTFDNFDPLAVVKDIHKFEDDEQS